MNNGQMKFIVKEKHIESGLNASRKNKICYSILMIIIFNFASLASYCGTTSVPIVFYENTYLCKSSSTKMKNSQNNFEFDIKCKKEFVCNEENKEGIDFILDKSTSRRSFISDYNIYCDTNKISLLGVGFFLGGVIGLLLHPSVISWIGSLPTIMCSLTIFALSSLIIVFVKNYYVGLFFFSMILLSNVLIVSMPYYITEMVKPEHRSIFMGINLSSLGLSGLYSNAIIYYFNDFHILFLINVGIVIIAIIMMKFLMVESIRTSFIRGNFLQIRDDLEYMAKLNSSTEEFIQWRDMVYAESEDHLSQLSMEKEDKNKYHLINFFSLFKIKSQLKNFAFFTLANFVNQYNLLFLQLEVKKSTNVIFTSNFSYIMDICGFYFGMFIIEWNLTKRWTSCVLLNLICGGLYISSGVIKLHDSFSYLFELNRFFNSAYFTALFTYNFEIYPTLIRATASSMNRTISRTLNFWTPYLMIKHDVLSYVFVGSMNLLSALLLVVLDIPETKGKVIEEFPIEFREKEIEISKEDTEDQYSSLQNKKTSTNEK
jgi:MFS family permease